MCSVQVVRSFVRLFGCSFIRIRTSVCVSVCFHWYIIKLTNTAMRWLRIMCADMWMWYRRHNTNRFLFVGVTNINQKCNGDSSVYACVFVCIYWCGVWYNIQYVYGFVVFWKKKNVSALLKSFHSSMLNIQCLSISVLNACYFDHTSNIMHTCASTSTRTCMICGYTIIYQCNI